jgi:hypothetical protein
MSLGDWLTLIGVVLLIIGVDGWVLLETSGGPTVSDRAAQGRGRRLSVTDAISGLLRRWRPEAGRSAALRATADGLRVEAHDLTDYVCRLADGSMGRVAIIAGTDEEWTAICVPA